MPSRIRRCSANRRPRFPTSVGITGSTISQNSSLITPTRVIEISSLTAPLKFGRHALVTVPADKSVLDAVKPFRPDIAYSCRQGFCGTCRVPAVGRPAGMLICTERTAGERVVLDL
ncbi:2Fe-2S iron-sulfur cluster-binding protein [Rhodococcus sovatensis]|uniref:2Fe-2S iron-sulfur cluster-binding protein n=1 Tax=Rhodococcus sovatensis TaxID=1805840 RepID=A0ABZ2PFS0_9NOCA